MLQSDDECYKEILILPININFDFYIYLYEEFRDLEGLVKFIVYPNKENTCWYVCGVKKHRLSNSVRVKLYRSWRGKENALLKKTANLDDAIFVSVDGSKGCCLSQENAIEMARRSLKKYNL